MASLHKLKHGLSNFNLHYVYSIHWKRETAPLVMDGKRKSNSVTTPLDPILSPPRRGDYGRWEDVHFLPQVSAHFVPPRPPRKMRSFISLQRIVDISSHHLDFTNAFRSTKNVNFFTRYCIDVRGVSLHSRGCPEGLLKRTASRDHSSRPPSGVHRTDDSG
ncbi:hypothetical protein TNCV_1233061 [Trichonephila clavipes]|nr:hypothetical protein TNCV_1233061 [Trichonephila clavipes]